MSRRNWRATSTRCRQHQRVIDMHLNRRLYPIRERLGPDFRFHDLRHTIYAHADLTEKRAALDRLGSLLPDE